MTRAVQPLAPHEPPFSNRATSPHELAPAQDRQLIPARGSLQAALHTA